MSLESGMWSDLSLTPLSKLELAKAPNTFHTEIKEGIILSKNIFDEKTGVFSLGDSKDTQKQANINARTTLPRLEVGGQSKSLSNKNFNIGRDKSNQLIIADPKVSRLHAVVNFENGEAYITDTNSSNGTYVNGIQIPPNTKHKLKDGDKIKLGTTLITFYK